MTTLRGIVTPTNGSEPNRIRRRRRMSENFSAKALIAAGNSTSIDEHRTQADRGLGDPQRFAHGVRAMRVELGEKQDNVDIRGGAQSSLGGAAEKND